MKIYIVISIYAQEESVEGAFSSRTKADTAIVKYRQNKAPSSYAARYVIIERDLDREYYDA